MKVGKNNVVQNIEDNNIDNIDSVDSIDNVDDIDANDDHAEDVIDVDDFNSYLTGRDILKHPLFWLSFLLFVASWIFVTMQVIAINLGITDLSYIVDKNLGIHIKSGNIDFIGEPKTFFDIQTPFDFFTHDSMLIFSGVLIVATLIVIFYYVTNIFRDYSPLKSAVFFVINMTLWPVFVVFLWVLFSIKLLPDVFTKHYMAVLFRGNSLYYLAMYGLAVLIFISIALYFKSRWQPVIKDEVVVNKAKLKNNFAKTQMHYDLAEEVNRRQAMIDVEKFKKIRKETEAHLEEEEREARMKYKISVPYRIEFAKMREAEEEKQKQKERELEADFEQYFEHGEPDSNSFGNSDSNSYGSDNSDNSDNPAFTNRDTEIFSSSSVRKE